MRLPDGGDVDAGITDTGRWSAEPLPDAEALPGRYVLAGLVDAHCHLSVGQGEDGPIALDLTAARANLDAARAAGVTGIRDTGSPGSVSLELHEDVLACGRFLAPAGQYFPALHVPVEAPDLIDAALAEIAAGARWIKLVGDFPTLGPTRTAPTPTYPLVEVARLVEAVHAAGGRVAAHSTTRHVSGLIAAGIDSVEHGTELSEPDLAALGARGAAWTLTLSASIGFRPLADPDRERARLDRRERFAQLLPLAAAQGVTIMMGTDVVGTMPGEVALLVGLGVPPTAALAAASTAARRYLGLGDLTDGQPADLVTYAADPRENPEVLAHPVAVFAKGTRIH